MPSTGMPSAIFASMPGEARELVLHLARPLPHRRGEQQLAARRQARPRSTALGQRALVGDRERADLLDLVAEELDAHRVLGGRREDVEDAAAHRELAAAGDHVDAGVGEVDELRPRSAEVVAAAAGRRARSARARRGCRRAAAGRRARRRRRRAVPRAASGPVVHAPQGVQAACRRSRRSGSAARAAGSPRRGTRGSRRRAR